MVKAAADWAAANLEKRDLFRVEPMNGTEGYIMADGNGGCLGALYEDCGLQAGIPLPLQPRLPRHLPTMSRSFERIRRQAGKPVPLSRQRMSWLPLAWWLVPVGQDCGQ